MAILYALEPIVIEHTNALLTDIIFINVFLLSLVSLFIFLRKNYIYYLIASAIFLGLATLIRPIAQFFPVIILLTIFIYLRHDLLLKLKYSLLYLIIFVSILSPWLYRNYQHFGVIKLVSATGYNFLFYDVAMTEYARQHNEIGISSIFRQSPSEKDLLEIRDGFMQSAVQLNTTSDPNPFVSEKIYTTLAFDYLKKYPLQYLTMHLTKSLAVFRPSNSLSSKLNINNQINTTNPKSNIFSIIINIIVSLYLLFMYLLAIIGFWQLIKKRQTNIVVFVICTILYFILIIGVIGQSRYKLPIVPIYLIPSAIGLNYLLKNKQTKST